jgi:ATP-dependent Clp protease, protease subunit
MAKHTGRTVEQIERDVDRDRFMSSDEAKQYGLIDNVIVQARALATTERKASL